MATEIYSQTHGRAISSYDLLDEIERYGLTRREAHDAIHAILDGLIADDPGVILDRRPARPELDHANPYDRDRDEWLTISDETADAIREALTATYGA